MIGKNFKIYIKDFRVTDLNYDSHVKEALKQANCKSRSVKLYYLISI